MSARGNVVGHLQYLYVAPFDIIRAKLEEHVPYDAPEGEGIFAGAGGGDDEDAGDDDDWMAIFEEAEKNLGTDGEEVEEATGGDAVPPPEPGVEDSGETEEAKAEG